MFADVILPLNLPQVLTYGVPVELQDHIRPGMRVEVQLGKNKQYSGIVERLHEHRPETYVVKPIRGLIDEEPVVTQQQLDYWRWIAGYYMAAPGEVMQAALPAHLKLMGETRLQWVGDDSVYYAWSTDAQRVVDALRNRAEVTLTEVRAMVGAGRMAVVLNELIEQEAVLINEALEQAYKPKKEKVVVLGERYVAEPALRELFDKLGRAPKQLQLLMGYLELTKRNKVVRQTELLERVQATAAQLTVMVEKGIFALTEQVADRLAYSGPEEIQKEPALTEAQLAALQAITEGHEKGKVVLLHGVTGSGKTLLYIHKIKECLAAGKQALLLLPEIALTTHLVSRLMAWFGEELGVYHSHFSNNERVEIWEKVRKGAYKVIVGPRSAMWLPYRDMGLIIVDEEHDSSFKQKDPAPRFHARDAAVYMAGMYGAHVVLGSATPSIESLWQVQRGRYAYAALRERYQGVNLPSITIVDAKSLSVSRSSGVRLLTPELQTAITGALQQRRQVILFQNRRGYVPFLLCTSCGWTPRCKNCDVTLTYHKSTDKMQCHYCGFKAAVQLACPQCGSRALAGKSFGTEKIEEEVQQLYPEARVARMDVDSMRSRNSVHELFARLQKRKVDILAGTQMVVKGLDFDGVSLVGIISADSLLSFPDFRVNERAFQLMEQVSGRAGRADGEGQVLIQAYNTKHMVLQWVLNHDVRAFYKHEIAFREQFFYPPFSKIIRIIFRHHEEAKVAAAAQLMADNLQQVQGVHVQGPGAALVPRVRNQYIKEIQIKCPRNNELIVGLKQHLQEQRLYVLAQRGNSNVQIVFDVDPA